MTNLKKALQTNEAKGKGVTVSPSYAMKQLNDVKGNTSSSSKSTS